VQVEQAMGISTATGFAMDFVSAAEGAKGYHAGKAAMGGVIAAELVEAGMVGPIDALESRVVGAERMHPGYLDLLSDLPDSRRLLQDLGKVYELQNTGTKRYPGDGSMQAGVDAVRSMARTHGIKADEIEAINVHSMTHVKEENTYVRPTKPIEALFSYPHVIAVALIDGDVTPAMVLPEMLERPEVHAIRERVHLFVDPEYDKMWPGARPARVEIVTSRGTFEETVLYSKGTSQNPMTWDEYVEKFMLLAEDGLGSEGAKRVVDKIWQLDTVSDIADLTSLLRPVQGGVA
jgi:2-methylcitrate dehydratase